MTTAKKSKTSTGMKSFQNFGHDLKFKVEMILDKRMRNGKVQYFLKWSGFDESYNWWEPMENVEGLGLVPEFERLWNLKRQRRQFGKGTRKSAILSKSDYSTSQLKSSNWGNISKGDISENTNEVNSLSLEKDGFELGFEPEKIIGAMKHLGVLYFMIKWKFERDPGLLVCSQVVKEKCPQLVFEFYEERLCWPEITGGEE